MRVAISLAWFIAVLSVPAFAENSPQWRGPHRISASVLNTHSLLPSAAFTACNTPERSPA